MVASHRARPVALEPPLRHLITFWPVVVLQKPAFAKSPLATDLVEKAVVPPLSLSIYRSSAWYITLLLSGP